LYDLVADPYELTSRHADPSLAGVKAELARRLALLRGCRGAACRAGARVALALSYRSGRSRCTRSTVRVAVRGPDAAKAVRAEFRLAGRRFRVDARRPFTASVAGRRLATRRTTLLRVALMFADGREQTLDRGLRSCR